MQYTLIGVVRPERAPLTDFLEGRFGIDDDNLSEIRISILLNQVVVVVETEHPWDEFTLRNGIVSLLEAELAIVGFVTGIAYDLEITRVIQPDLELDRVFGVEEPCIVKRNEGQSLKDRIPMLRRCTEGPDGILIQRALVDLMMATRRSVDTGFYCYRAIEALQKHAAQQGQVGPSEKARWENFRSTGGLDRDDIQFIKDRADPVRHGGYVGLSAAERSQVLIKSWDIVESYLEVVSAKLQA